MNIHCTIESNSKRKLERTSMSMVKCIMAQLYMGYIAVEIRKQEIHYQYR